MNTLLCTQRSRIAGIYIAITTLALFTVAECLSFDQILNVHAAKDLKVKVSIDDEEIERGDTQKITVTVLGNDNSNDKISDADVKLSVHPPETDSTTAEDETNDDGKANFDVEISDDAEYGTYEVKVKASKEGYNTETEESSFEVVGSSSEDNEGNRNNDNNNHENDDDNSRDDGNDEGHDSDNEGGDRDGNNQVTSQGNSCGNGVLSSNILCQNVANQLQGDGNAINIIALQNGGNDDSQDENLVSNPSSSLSSSSIPLVPPSSSTSGTSQESSQLPSSLSDSPTNDDSTESTVDQYVQARINSAIQARLNYLK
jgi:5-hydroxyisourate hydrolase-like protein (transthyretin family)